MTHSVEVVLLKYHFLWFSKNNSFRLLSFLSIPEFMSSEFEIPEMMFPNLMQYPKF